MELPKYKITTAQSTDPLYAGVLGTAKANWGGASMGSKLLELHPGLSNVLPSAKSSTELKPYFDNWYMCHAAEMAEARLRLTTQLDNSWPKIIGLVQALTVDVAWPKEPIILALSAVYPSNFWGGTFIINQYFDRPTFAPSLVHELIHLRTEVILGEDWFVARHVTADKRAIFMELSAEVVLSRSTDELAQAARGTYPFFADYYKQLKQASGVPGFVEMCDILAQF